MSRSYFVIYFINAIQVDSKKPVLVHGDKEKAHMEKVHHEGGLRYVENQHKTNSKLAEELKVDRMVSKTVILSSDEPID